LVKQFLQTVEAAKFYRTLLQFSQNENLFSEVQPGFLEGNISSASGNINDRVIGFFSVASVTEQRLFFNYADYLPPPEGCGGARSLVELIKLDRIEFVEVSAKELCQGPYLVTQRPCGDCTVLGSNVEPEFWME